MFCRSERAQTGNGVPVSRGQVPFEAGQLGHGMVVASVPFRPHPWRRPGTERLAAAHSRRCSVARRLEISHLGHDPCTRSGGLSTEPGTNRHGDAGIGPLQQTIHRVSWVMLDCRQRTKSSSGTATGSHPRCHLASGSRHTGSVRGKSGTETRRAVARWLGYLGRFFNTCQRLASAASHATRFCDGGFFRATARAAPALPSTTSWLYLARASATCCPGWYPCAATSRP